MSKQVKANLSTTPFDAHFRLTLRLTCLLLTTSIATGCADDAPEDTTAPTCNPQAVTPVSVTAVVELGPNSHRAETSIIIDRSPAQVWATLTDFDNMPKWSTSFQGSSGDFRNGGEVVAHYLFADPMTGEVGPVSFPHVLSLTEGEQFGWSDPLVGFEGITDNHIFTLLCLFASSRPCAFALKSVSSRGARGLAW